MSLRAKLATDFKAILVWEHYIENEGMGLELFRDGQSLGAGCRGANIKAHETKAGRNKFTD